MKNMVGGSRSLQCTRCWMLFTSEAEVTTKDILSDRAHNGRVYIILNPQTKCTPCHGVHT